MNVADWQNDAAAVDAVFYFAVGCFNFVAGDKLQFLYEFSVWLVRVTNSNVIMSQIGILSFDLTVIAFDDFNWWVQES